MEQNWRVYVQEVNTDDMRIRIQLERLGETGFDEYVCGGDPDEYEEQQRKQWFFFKELFEEGKEWNGEYTAEGGRCITTNNYVIDEEDEWINGRPTELHVYEGERFTNSQGQEFQDFTIDFKISLHDRFLHGEYAADGRLFADRKKWFEGIFVVMTNWRQLRNSRKNMVWEMWKAGDTWITDFVTHF